MGINFPQACPLPSAQILHFPQELPIELVRFSNISIPPKSYAETRTGDALPLKNYTPVPCLMNDWHHVTCESVRAGPQEKTPLWVK